jgi:TM2 domain-containing membrane protein YozV
MKEAEICPKCGVRQHSSQPIPAQAQVVVQQTATTKMLKSKVVAGVLGIFLGGIGVHKFYLGNVGIGLVYILFAWTLVPALIGFIEGIIYLTYSGTDEEFTVKYAH